MQLTKISENESWISFTFADGYELYFELNYNRPSPAVKTLTIMRNVDEIAKLHIGPISIQTGSVTHIPTFPQSKIASRWQAIIDYLKSQDSNYGELSQKAQTILSNERSCKVITLLKKHGVREES